MQYTTTNQPARLIRRQKYKTRHHSSLQLYCSTESIAKLRCHSVVCKASNKNEETKEKIMFHKYNRKPPPSLMDGREQNSKGHFAGKSVALNSVFNVQSLHIYTQFDCCCRSVHNSKRFNSLCFQGYLENEKNKKQNKKKKFL